MKKSLLPLCGILILGLSFSACKKDKKEDPKPKTKTELLTNKNWKLVASTVDPAFPANNTLYTNLFTILRDCYKDNLLRFETPNVFKYDEGPTKCNATDTQTHTGTWTFNLDETKITTTFTSGGNTSSTTYDVLELSDGTLKVSYIDQLGTTTNFVVTDTYSKQ